MIGYAPEARKGSLWPTTMIDRHIAKEKRPVDAPPAVCHDDHSRGGSGMHADQEPYCDFRMTVRVEIPNSPGQFASLTAAFAAEGANLGAIDIVEVRRGRMIRD